MSKHQMLYSGIVALTAALLSVGCAVEETSMQTEDSGAKAEAAAISSEVLAVDVTESMNRGLFGKRQDYYYPLGGRKIIRHEFHVDTHGHANASIDSMDSNQVKVHAWADAFSGYTFTLKVWVEQ